VFSFVHVVVSLVVVRPVPPEADRRELQCGPLSSAGVLKACVGESSEGKGTTCPSANIYIPFFGSGDSSSTDDGLGFTTRSI
jgi:hypothetical protein